MLIWVCALHCEAKPVIDYYRLKKCHDENAFDLYLGDQMICVITGIGKIASASACAWAGARFDAQTPIAWINLGIAGASSRTRGDACLINQVIDADNQARFYPAPLKISGLDRASCMTLSQASCDYHPEDLYDQEASGFIYAALRFSSCELTQCLKIVSDNEIDKRVGKRQEVSDMIHQNMDGIDALAGQLQILLNELQAQCIPRDFWQETLQSCHFSQTQRNRLQGLLSYLVSRKHKPDDLQALIAQDRSAGKIIQSLESLAHSDSSDL